MEHPAYSQLRPVTPSVGVVLCPNPSYAALEGTNSWIIRAPGDTASVVVDPGPEDEGHLNVLRAAATEGGAHIALILLTHRHTDHADGAERFRQLSGAPVRAVDLRNCLGGEVLEDGERITVEGLTPTIEVVRTPGHTGDSTSFFIHTRGGEDDADVEGIMTGDTIAGRHTTMISETDGDLGEYLRSLATLRDRGRGVPLLPGHGPDQPDTSELAQKYIDRRELRLSQVRDAVAELGPEASVGEIVDRIYTDVDPVLRDAAKQSTRVTLRYLENTGNAATTA
ncbi:MBL fold metallo-hydrolase [Corynebacterium bovis]|uniref:MBL fold metallo-hydrolase n=2 Tax=Corynebacterium bovis TaxID=36808 RepID=A0A3R8RDW0_9CORY|nr:MBL fold metallo-hydrolase [Corynebacterium bovis]MBB3116203.1 glyoxylase-like metal-dependent hydrolase (beta-lactamase superfamily II) [Corynebacterium bovis DSM 20582 = CIP 54.80]MDK8510867.1 MBL fold metallo-hydrolase [Corynebacterium bovis]MDN8579638.1 MBL fold metallo-hydrolase [Corynebacterium bovis]QQC47117.1 MBL fold metallo-hydrolase [Corynebacterium bovis]RRO78900.1 MBL fold metallo-hydrolase [Corynebacterium bovis]